MTSIPLARVAVKSGPNTYELPATARPGMRVPVRVFADEELWGQMSSDRSLEQLTNVATLPGVTDHVFAMPDMHEGYGFPVGAAAAFRADEGVISPGGVGYDINCGVRLAAAEIAAADVGTRMESLVHDLSRTIPSGTGRGGKLGLSPADLHRVLGDGVRFLVDRDLALPEDVIATESEGSLEDADPSHVSERARQRGASQLGTIGSGNHFVEVQVVDEVFDSSAARALGLWEGQLTVLVHTGSRGLGHQVCTDYVRLMDEVMPRYGITLPDRQLACAPFSSTEGQAYFGAMCAAANFAWSNRQAILHLIRSVFARSLGSAGQLRLVYDVAHNIAKVEEYGGQTLCVHRKGATRAFGPTHAETPNAYQGTGQPVFIPGSMGTASYVLVGTDASASLSFGSTCHGAGRRMSRGAARRMMHGSQVRKSLTERGIVVRCSSNKELAEEAPHSYKDVERVVDVVHAAGLARKVVRLKPLGVVKG